MNDDLPTEIDRMDDFSTFYQENEFVGDYKIVKELGRGGMGVVYLAIDTAVNHRKVVLKFILKNVRKNKKRFLREAEAASALDHPNIVRVLKVFFPRGKPCIVMEYKQGKSLQEYILENSLSLKHTLEIIGSVAQSLHYAHQKKVIHRDIKPANILIDSNGAPILMDFGLAKIQKVDKSFTRTGEIMGSPGYMSPEQARGQKNLDINTDVYSLGVVMYEMITGKKMFPEDVMSFLYHVINAHPVPPRSIDPDIPPEVERICMKAIEKPTRKRYQTAWEMACDLQNFLEGKGQSATKKMLYGMKKTARYHKISITLCIAIISIIIMYWAIPVAPKKDQDYYNRLDSKSLLLDTLIEKANFHYGEKQYKMAEEDYSLAITKQPNNAKLYLYRGNLYYDMYFSKEPLDKYLKFSEEDYTKAISLSPKSQLYYKRAQLFQHSGRPQKALIDCTSAIELAPKDLRLYYLRGKIFQHLNLLEEAQLDFEKVLQGDYNNKADVLVSLGLVYHTKKNYDRAQKFYEEALQLEPDSLGALYHLGIIYQINSELQDAKSFFAKCIEKHQHPESYLHMGVCLAAQGKYLEAEKYYNEAIQRAHHKNARANWLCMRGKLRYQHLQNETAAQEDFTLAYNLASSNTNVVLVVAKSYKNLGSLEAKKYYDHYISLTPNSADGYFQRAIFWGKFKKFESALEDYSKAIEIAPKNRTYFYYRANVYKEMKKYKEAILDLDIAIKLKKPPHPDYFYAKSECYKYMGKYSEAIQEVNHAIELGPRSLYYLHRALIRVEMMNVYQSKKYDFFHLVEKDYYEAIDLDPKNKELYVYLSVFYRNQEQYEKSLDVVRLGRSRRFYLLREEVNTLHAKGSYDKALAILEKEQEKNPENEYVYIKKSEILLSQKKYQLCLDNLEILIQKENLFAGYFRRAKLYLYHLNDYEKAFADITNALKVQPQSVSGLELKMMILTKLKKYDEVTNTFEKLLEIHPKTRNVHKKMALLYFEMGKYKEAEQQYNILIELGPPNPDIYWKRASVYKKMGKIPEALQDIKKAQQMLSEERK